MNYFYLLLILLGLGANSYADELVNIEALNNKVHLLVPKDFAPMPKDILEKKYPMSRRPTEVLSNPSGTVSLGLSHTNSPLQPVQIRDAHIAISKMFHTMFPTAQWIKDGIIEQNGSTFMVMEFISPAIDTSIHNIIYGTSVDGRFLLATFNTTVELSNKWLPIGRKIMGSLTVN